MFQGFSKNRSGFHGFIKSIVPEKNLDWNGYPVRFWLDPSHGLSLTGGLIDAWSDKVHGLRHLPTAINQRATLIPSDPNFGGNPSVTTIGSTSLRAEALKGTTLEIGRGFTIATVHAVANFTGRTDIFCGSPSFSPNLALGGTRVQHNGLGICYFGDSVRLGTNYETTAPTIAVWTVERILANGVELPITSGSAPAQVDSWGKCDWVGGGGAGGGCIIAEILCFPFEATLSECFDISEKLNNKYSIY